MLRSSEKVSVTPLPPDQTKPPSRVGGVMSGVHLSGEGEGAGQRQARGSGQRTGGPDEPAPRAAEARETRRPGGGGIGL